MDSIDVRNLYNAYRQVCESQQSLNESVDLDEASKIDTYFRNTLEPKEGPEVTDTVIKARRFSSGKTGNIKTNRQRRLDHKISANQSRRERDSYDEELDTYDLVLEYLLDEGYCDDEQSAEVIMANMSEEWLAGILDEEIVRRGVSVNAAGDKIPWTHRTQITPTRVESSVTDKFGTRNLSDRKKARNKKPA